MGHKVNTLNIDIRVYFLKPVATNHINIGNCDDQPILAKMRLKCCNQRLNLGLPCDCDEHPFCNCAGNILIPPGATMAHARDQTGKCIMRNTNTSGGFVERVKSRLR